MLKLDQFALSSLRLADPRRGDASYYYEHLVKEAEERYGRDCPEKTKFVRAFVDGGMSMLGELFDSGEVWIIRRTDG